MLPVERRNAKRFGLAEGMWGVGVGLTAPLTVLPLLFRQLDAGPVEIGFIYSLFTAGFLLTQPLGMLWLQHGAGKKRLLLLVGLLFSIPHSLLIGLLILHLAPARQVLTRLVLLVLFSIKVLGIGLIIPIWQDWFAGLFRREARGRATGMACTGSALGVSLAALFAAWMRHGFPFPANYALLFLCSAPLYGASLAIFSRIEEGVESGVRRPRLSALQLLGRFGHSLRDVNFRNYLIARILLTMGAGGTAFFAVHFASPAGGEVGDGAVIGLGGLLTLAQAGVAHRLGRMGDRAGHKAGVFLGATAQIAAIGTAILGRGPLACGLCFALSGVALAAGMVSHANMIYETCPHDCRVAHITLSNLVLSPFVLAVPLVTGCFVSGLGVRHALVLTLVPSMLGAVYLAVRVRNPREVVLPPESRPR